MGGKPAKERIRGKMGRLKGKMRKVKDKVKDKVKRALTGASCVALAAALAAGCMDTAPASRATSAQYRFDIRNCRDVRVTNGDGAMASADSAGSTESQTATPTLDVRARLDARYNDAISGASAASRGVLSSIGSGLDAVLGLMASKKSGTVAVTKQDGSAGTVRCENGQCEWCEDCIAK